SRRVSAAVDTSLCPGAAATTTTSPSRPSAERARAARATCPLCGGAKAPPKRPNTARTRRTLRPPRRRRPGGRPPPPAAARARPPARRGAGDPEAALGPHQAPAPHLRGRAVDQELRQRVFDLRARLGLRDEPEQCGAELLDALARRAREPEHGDDPLVGNPEG